MDPRDIFYLSVEEALGFVEGTAVSANLRDLAVLRRKEFDGYRAGPPPSNRFSTRGAVHLGNAFRSAQPAVPCRPGIPCKAPAAVLGWSAPAPA
ncbi:MAG: hypothetical protein U1F61_09685 [Opitutaceae bacterium]